MPRKTSTRRGGYPSRYHPKVRAPLSVSLTAQGHEYLAVQAAAAGLSRSDWIETLVRDRARRSPRA